MKSKYQVAEKLVRAHFDLEPGLQEVYIFIDEPEDDPDVPIRLLEVDRDTFSDDSLEPFHFRATKDVPFPTVIAVITPKKLEELKSTPHSGWDLAGAKNLRREVEVPCAQVY